jgi:hypothetical protein
MTRECHVRFCESAEVRFLRATHLVILSRGHADKALAWTRRVMTKLGLAINETKTSVRDARQEHFDVLGYTFGPITIGRTATGIWGRARPRRAYSG